MVDPILQLMSFVVVLNQIAGPLDCKAVSATEITCSNQATATALADGRMEFNGGIVLTRPSPTELTFSNGITGRMDSFGWLEFSNGFGLREMDDGSLKFTNELVCRMDGSDKASCAMGKSGVRDGCGFNIFRSSCWGN